MTTTKADRLLRSVIDAGLSLTDFILLATKVIRLQHDFKTGSDDRRERDRKRQQEQRRDQHQFEQQLKEEEQRRMKGLAKLRELGYVTGEDTYPTEKNQPMEGPDRHIRDKDERMKTDKLLLPYSKEINDLKQKQRDCCLTFNIDYDLRLNQQRLEAACRRAKRNIYELRADRFNRPEYRSVLSVETVTLHSKLKEAIREINRTFLDDKSQQDRRHLQELLTYINQFEGDVDLLMCQMQYEPKVKETILFSPVTTDILDRMNLILHYVRTLAKKISTGDYLDKPDEITQGAEEEDELMEDLSSVPSKVTYIIKIKTNAEISSSLSDDTNVFIKLHGTYTKTPDIRLVQSIQKTKWQSGQIDLFNIELNYLGDIYAMEIWHDSPYSSWKVDWIEVIDDAANTYRFPLDRLFDKYAEEKKTRFTLQRDLGPVNRLPTKPDKHIRPYRQLGFVTYTAQVKTGKQPNKATDSLIFMELRGEDGSFTDNLCSAYSALKSSVFEPDQLDTFYLIWPNLGKLQSLRLSIQSEGQQPSWFCEYITIEDGQLGDPYKFTVNHLLDGSTSDDPDSKRHITVYPDDANRREEKDKPGYFLKLKTGDKGLPATSKLPSITVTLKGEKGKSEPYTLTSVDKKKKLFRENQTDEFLLPWRCYVGPIQVLKLSSNDQLDRWFIETIIVRDIKQGQDYLFPIFKWIKSADGTSALTVRPINEQKPDYIVCVRTISSELNGPDRSIKLLVQGSRGKGEMELNHPITMHNNFQPAHKDEYFVSDVHSLGELQSIEIDISHPNINKLGLDYIEIKDLSTSDSYRFNVNRVLDAKNPKTIFKAEPISHLVKKSSSTKSNRSQLSLPPTASKKNFDQLTTSVPQGAKRPIKDDYRVSIKTGRSSLIGANPVVHLQLFGDKGTSDKVPLNKSNTSSTNLFESNQQDTFSLTIPDIGHLKSATLSVDGKTETEWSVSTLEIVQGNSKKVYQADINATLGGEQNGKSEITVDLNERSERRATAEHDNASTLPAEENIYKIKIKTIHKQFPNEDTKLQLEFAGEHGQSERIILDRASEKNELPQKEKVDVFTIDVKKDLGQLKTVKLSLSEPTPSKKTLYQTEFIEIFHPKTNRTYRIGYAKDEFLSSEKNRVELTKSVRPLSDTNIREKAHPQGAMPSSSKRLPDSLQPANDDEDLSLLNNTTISSTSRENNSLSDRLTNSSSRQIRPGDRVKNSSRRYSLDQPVKSSAHEGDWQRRSNEIKQVQAMSGKRTSQPKFDHRQAPIIKSRHNDESQNIARQGSKEKKLISHEQSLTQRKTTSANELPNRASMSRTRQSLNELQKEMMLVIDSPTPSNLSELTDSIEPSRTSVEQSKTSARSSKTSSQLPAKEESKHIDRNASKTKHNDQRMITVPSKSVAPNSRTSSDASPRQSLPSSTSRTPASRDNPSSARKVPINAGDQSEQTHRPSPIRNSNQISPEAKTIRTDDPSNTTKPHKESRAPTEKTIVDPMFDRQNLQPNPLAISAVTIHTIATRSDSDSNFTRQSTASQESEQSLLSPDNAKKSRRNRRRDHRQNTRDEHLSKEMSDVQYAPRASLKKSQSDKIAPPTEKDVLGTRYQNQDTSNIRPVVPQVNLTKEPTIQSYSKGKDVPSRSTPFSTKIERDRLPDEAADVGLSSLTMSRMMPSRNLPTGSNGLDHMSTVFEESEPSAVSASHLQTSSLSERGHNEDNIHDWLGTSSSLSSTLQKGSLKDKSPSPLNHHKKTIDAISKPTAIKSNTSINYELRVQTGNESQLDGTNEPVSVQLTNAKNESIKIPLISTLNNSRPFQKGQLDIFHLKIPKHFHSIGKITFSLPQSNKDPLHLLYCELQDRHTMHTLHSPIDKWLGKENLYEVEMFLNNDNRSL